MGENQTEITKAYYDKRFGSLSQNLNEEETIRWNAIEEVLKKNFEGSDIQVTDFGCGRGWLSHKLSASYTVTGFDISEQSIENAKRSFPGVNFVCLDASQPIPETFHEKFDLVVSSEVIEHIHDQKEYLKNIRLILKKNGHFLITTPNGTWKGAFYKEGREAWKQPVENWLTKEQLCGILSELNLTVKKATTFNAEWIFNFQPKLNPTVISHPLMRKTLKVLGLYKKRLRSLNQKHFGLNLLVFGQKA